MPFLYGVIADIYSRLHIIYRYINVALMSTCSAYAGDAFY